MTHALHVSGATSVRCASPCQTSSTQEQGSESARAPAPCAAQPASDCQLEGSVPQAKALPPGASHDTEPSPEPKASNLCTTKIEWTDVTWNPVRGCDKVSPGCKHCYAETFAERFRGVPGHPYEHGFALRLVPGKLAEPLREAKPSRIFVNSMSDLFHRGIPDPYVALVTEVMVAADWHVFQVLTKRADRLAAMLDGQLRTAAQAPHIWWGVSVEDRKYGLPRIQELRSAPARNRFLSIEPLLEDLGEIDLQGIHWVIVGGESGPGARPMQQAWVESIRDQCVAAKVPFFFKQWGGVVKKKAGRLLNGGTYDDVPASSRAQVPPGQERARLVQRFSDEALRWSSEPLVQLARRRRG